MSFWDKLKQPKFRYGSLSVAIVIMSIALMVGVNIGAKFLTDKFSWSFDLTSNKIFSLTEDSVNYVKNIDKDVEIEVLNDKDKFIQKGDYYKQANSVINEYSRYNDKIKIKYINLSENPSFTSSYPDEELGEDSIIVKSGEKYKTISIYDLFNVQQSYTRAMVASSKAEQTMTSAIMYVVSDEQVKISMLTGFDELSSDGLEKLLRDNNYNVVKRSMLTENIDDGSSCAIVYAPKRDYDKESITKIKNYLYKDGNYGRNLICFLYPSQNSMPNLESLIEEWGMKTEEGIVLETDMSKLFSSESYFHYICEYVDETYSSAIKNTSIPVAVPLSKPIQVVDKDKVSTLLQFSETSVVAPGNADENWSPQDAQIKGPIPAMAMSTMKNDENGQKSTLTLVGSAASVDQNLLSRTSLNNSSYFLNLFNSLTNRENTINIEPKSIGGQELGMNPLHAIIIGLCLTIVLPIVILIAGIVVWIIKRKK